MRARYNEVRIWRCKHAYMLSWLVPRPLPNRLCSLARQPHQAECRFERRDQLLLAHAAAPRDAVLRRQRAQLCKGPGAQAPAFVPAGQLALRLAMPLLLNVLHLRVRLWEVGVGLG